MEQTKILVVDDDREIVGAIAALLELETRYCRQEPYISLGRYIHVTALKPQMQG